MKSPSFSLSRILILLLFVVVDMETQDDESLIFGVIDLFLCSKGLDIYLKVFKSTPRSSVKRKSIAVDVTQTTLEDRNRGKDLD